MPDSVIPDSVVPYSTFACYAQFRCARFPQADFLSSVTARSSESFGLKLIYKSYFMPKIQWINISIVNKLSFWSEYGVLLLQGVP